MLTRGVTQGHLLSLHTGGTWLELRSQFLCYNHPLMLCTWALQIRRNFYPVDFNNCTCDSQTSESQMQNDRNWLAPAETVKWLCCKSKVGEFLMVQHYLKRTSGISNGMRTELFFLFILWYRLILLWVYLKPPACWREYPKAVLSPAQSPGWKLIRKTLEINVSAARLSGRVI